MASVRGDVRLNDYMSRSLNLINQALKMTVSEMNNLSKATGSKVDTTGLDKIASKLIKIDTEISNAVDEQENLNKKVKETTAGYTGLGNVIKTVVGALGIKKLVDLSDQSTQITARLNLMNDGQDDIDDLKNKIFASAQRARVDYMDQSSVIASLGMQAGDAFDNDNDQIIAFSENLSKLFTTSGLDSSGISSTMYNLTQSLSSGSLLGNDYRILKQNAPQMIKYIQDYYGVTRKELDDMVSKGEVSAQGIKNAIFNATDDINSKFNEMPMTWGQVWTSICNRAIKASEPLLEAISWLAQNWGTLEPIVLGLATAVGTYVAIQTAYNIITAIGAGVSAIHAAGLMLQSGATFKATVAQHGLNTALLACPITWIVIAIVALVAVLIYLWNTNDKVAEAMLWAWDNFLIGLQIFGLGFKGMWYGLLDFLGYFKVGGLGIIDGFINGAILLINGFIEMLNKIPGVAIDTISWRSTMAADAAAEFAQEKAERDAELAQDALDIYNKKMELDATREDRVQNRAKLDISETINGLTDGLDVNNVANVENVEGEVNVASEDLKLLRELAEQQYIQNYISNAPVQYITTGDIHENADIDYLIDGVRENLSEAINTSMEGVPVG